MSRGPRPPSLLANLFGRMGVLFVAVVLFIGGATFLVTRYSVDEMYDDQLIVGAKVLHLLMSEELTEARHNVVFRGAIDRGERALLSNEDRRALKSYAEWRMFRVWAGNKLVLQSGQGPPQLAPPQRDGLRDVRAGTVDWRIYVLRVPEHNLTVEVGERVDIRRVLVRGILLSLALPLAVMTPIAGLLIWVALRGGLQAFSALLAEVRGRAPRDLSPIGYQAWPRDLHPLISAMNGLFARITGSLQHERRFLDDAAHQLRTPLAGVKLQAQMIAQEGDQDERRILVSGLLASVDRASALTNDLLTLAQLDAWELSDGAASGDVWAETAAALADLAPLAARRHVALTFDVPPGLSGGDPLLLRLIVANLVENAIHHAPPGSEVAIRAWRAAGRRYLTVIDEGPGIPRGEREQVLRRFSRGRNAAPNGSGLGLSIVVAALEILGGHLSLTRRDDARSGLKAVVVLPDALAA